MAPLVVLIGPPGAGKTTVGRAVADHVGVDFVDVDHVIEERAGRSITDIFVNDGETAFRALEEAAVADALETATGVVALGGGAVMRETTRGRLAGHRVVWLQVDAPDAAQRVGMNTARPLLLGNVRATLTTLLEERNPVYASVATAVVPTDGRSIDAVVDDVVEVVARA